VVYAGSVCPATATAGVWCDGAFEPGASFCPPVTTAAAGVWCGGVFEPGAGFCPPVNTAAAGVWCDGAFEPGASFCPPVNTAAAGVWCNGVFESGVAACPGVNFAGVNCGGVYYAGQAACPSVTVNAAVPVPNAVVPPAGEALTMPAGWDMVGGPSGTVITGNSGPMYAFSPGDTTYTVVPNGSPLQSGMGYWAYFNQPTTESLAIGNSTATNTDLPPGQFVMIGNGGNTTATVSGADTVLTWDGTSYTQVNQLNPGQGAWAISQFGAQASIVNSPI